MPVDRRRFLGLPLLLAAGACRAPREPAQPRAARVATGRFARPRLLVERLRGINISERRDRRYHERDFADLKAWGASAVRLLVTYGQVIDREPPHAIRPADLARIDTLYDLCERHGLYLVLVVSELPGYRYVDGNDNSLWTTPRHRERLVAFWREIARRYRGRGDTIAYDLLNEPHDTGGRWPALARELSDEIRRIDPDHTIVVEADEWSWPAGFATLRPTGDPNTVYSPHVYLPNDLTHGEGRGPYPGEFAHLGQRSRWDRARYERELAPLVEFARRHRVRLWVGEFGCVRWRPGLERWLADQVAIYERAGWGWAWYAYREWQGMDLERPDTADPGERLPDSARLRLFRSLLRRGSPP